MTHSYEKVKVVKRERNCRRKKNCSYVHKLSLAEYALANSKSSGELLEFITVNKFFFDSDDTIFSDRTILCMSDGSMIGLFKDGRAVLLDAMGRDNARSAKYRSVGA